jgi:hypothetical protein
MEVLLPSILFVLMVVYHLIYVYFSKPKTIGKIVLTKDNKMYVEFNDEESFSKIKSARYVTFKIDNTRE